MKTRHQWFVIVAAGLVGFYSAACELNESCDPAVDADCVAADASGDSNTGSDAGQEVDQTQSQTYNYVLVEDQDQNASGDTPGADIDAVELNQGGASIYLARIEQSGFGLGQAELQALTGNGNPNNLIGPPVTDCSRQDDKDQFYSLGGEGGFFIGSFTGLAEIQTGDTIRVHVCDVGAQSETWDLSVGVATDVSADTFVPCITGGLGTTDCTVPNLPAVPLN